MALAANEIMSGGFVVDKDTRAVSLVTSTVGATVNQGFLRDPDGRLVVISV